MMLSSRYVAPASPSPNASDVASTSASEGDAKSWKTRRHKVLGDVEASRSHYYLEHGKRKDRGRSKYRALDDSSDSSGSDESGSGSESDGGGGGEIRGSSREKSSSGMIWIIAVLILLILGVGAFFAYQYFHSGTSDVSASPTSSPAPASVPLQSASTKVGSVAIPAPSSPGFEAPLSTSGPTGLESATLPVNTAMSPSVTEPGTQIMDSSSSSYVSGSGTRSATFSPKPSKTSEKSSSTGASGSSHTASSSGSASVASSSGVLTMNDATCGASGASAQPGKGTGPNGKQEWLNCGISKDSPDAKWTPPPVTIADLKYITMEKAVTMSVFKACADYVSMFDKYGASTGIPPILLASIAMTESSCNAKTKGDNGGAWGLMQITSDKCGGAPGGDCSDPDFNIKTGAEYFQTVLKQNNNNVLAALGSYNGWFIGLTYKKATAAATSDCCVCQNNLDYQQSILNGFMQGVDGSQLGTYNNVACPGQGGRRSKIWQGLGTGL